MNKEEPTAIEKINVNINKADVSVQALSIKSVKLIQDLIRILRLTTEETNPVIENLISYDWSYEAKNIAILLRDGVLNLLKIDRFVKDGFKNKSDLEKYKIDLLQIVQEATSELGSKLELIYSKGGIVKDEWQHEANPSPFIIDQMENLINQIKTIQRSEHKLDKLSLNFNDYRAAYYSHMKQRKTSAESVNISVERLKDFCKTLPENINNSDLNKFIKNLEQSISEIEGQSPLNPYQFIVLEDPEKIKIAVDTQSGKLLYKNIDVLSEVTSWNSAHVAVPLRDADSKLKIYKEKTLASLLQHLNRTKAKIDAADNPEELKIKRSFLSSGFQKILTEYKNDIQNDCLEILTVVKEKLEKYIKVSQVFSKEYNFLPTSGIGQLAGFSENTELERRYNPARIKASFNNFINRLFSRYNSREEFTASGYIKYLLDFDTTSDANSLFLRKGFLGNSFTIDRPELFQKIDNHINLWKDGFGGGLLISGDSLSGKSTVIEMIPVMYPSITSHHIVPEQKLDVKGHKILMKKDLLQILNFIIKHQGQEKCIITIDDLSFYSQTPEELFDLVKGLFPLIRKYSKRIYFVVSIHNFLIEKLGLFFNLQNIFTEHIDTNYMPQELVMEALLTRAHAVSTAEELILKGDYYSTLARKIARKSNGKIGTAMQLWCMYQNENFKGEINSLDFKELVNQNKNILKLLVGFKNMSGPGLRKMLNDIDKRKIRTDLESLVHQRMIERPLEGIVRINPYLIVFVESILKRK